LSFKTLMKGMLHIICPNKSNFEVFFSLHIICPNQTNFELFFFAVQWNGRSMSILSSAFLEGNDQHINVVLQNVVHNLCSIWTYIVLNLKSSKWTIDHSATWKIREKLWFGYFQMIQQ
jgi:hypothetical protein